MKNKWIVAALLPAAAAYGQSSVSSEPNMIVTASRMLQSTDQILVPYTVVTAAQIEKMQAKSIADVLAMQPGIDIRSNGGRGQLTSIFIRGGNSGQALVLINGVRAMSASSGSADINFLPASLVERIEIIRGPRAVQYGADAMSGVINIITKPEQGTQRNRLTAGAGQNGYWQGSWNYVHSIKNHTQLHVAMNAEHSDGYNITPASLPARDYGYRTRQGVFGMTHQFNRQVSGHFNTLLSSGHADYNGNFSSSPSVLNRSIVLQQFYEGGLRYQNHSYLSQANLNYGVDDSRNEGSFSSRDVTQRYGLNWLNRWFLNDDWHVDAGIDTRQVDLGKSTTKYDETKRYNVGGYSSVSFDNGVYQSETSIRQDHNQRYGNNTNYSLAGGWYYLPEQQIKLSYATAFKAPSFSQLYYPNFGNSDLKPEKSRNLELGFAGHIKEIGYELNLYRNWYRDLIETDSSTFLPINVSKAQITGTEIILKFQTGSINQQVSYTYENPINGQTGQILAKRSWNQAKWQSDWQLNRFNLHTGLRWVGHSFSSSSRVRVPSYLILNLAAGYQINDDFKVNMSVHNALDRYYQTTYLYAAPGIQTNVTATYNF